MTVHGQADQRGLLRPAVQRGVLDAYAGSGRGEPRSTGYRDAFGRLAAIRAELDEVTTHRRERTLEAEGLRQGLAEVDEVAPQAGRGRTLAAEAARLGHAEALRAAAAAAHDALSATRRAPRPRPCSACSAPPAHELDAVRSHDPQLDALAARIAEASYTLADVAADLAGTSTGWTPIRPGSRPSQERLSRLAALTRRYAADIDGVQAWAHSARERLAALDDDDPGSPS